MADIEAGLTGGNADIDAALTGGNYEVLRSRLATGGQVLARRADTLNARRKALFGTTEPQLGATERVRTEHNCAPVDIVGVGDHLRLGYNVFLGLKSETRIGDVLALHRFEPQAGAGPEGGDGFDTSAVAPGAPSGRLARPAARRARRQPAHLGSPRGVAGGARRGG